MPGGKAFSEPETRAMKECIEKIRKQIGIYISIHSYSQFWMTPYSYTSTPPNNHYEIVSTPPKQSL